MQNFRYTALDSEGKQQQGTLQGESAKHIRQQLREQNLTPLSVDTTSKTSSLLGTFRQQTRSTSSFNFNKLKSASLKLSELAFFTRQLALLLQAGFTIEQALEGIKQQFTKPHINHIVQGIQSRVVEGFTLAQAIAEFPTAFPKIYSVSIEAGEQAGQLVLVLSRLADYTEQQLEIKQKIQQAILYPAITLFFSLSITIFLLTYLLPTITSVFAENAQSLPGITIFLMALSEGLRHYGIYIFIFLLAIFWLIRHLLKRPAYKYRWHQYLMYVPIVRYLLKSTNIARFTRTFGLLCASGLPAVEAMQLATKLVTHLPMQQSLQTATQRIREGSAINNALRQTSYFDTLSLNLITNGEQTGKLAEMLEQAALQQERQFTRFIQLSLSLMEPLMMVVMGGLVLFIVLAILLPIFSMNEMIN